MRLLKPTYRNRDGKLNETSKWYIEFRDHNEVQHRIAAFTSRPATEELARNLNRLVAFFRASGGQTDPSLQEWLRHLPRHIEEHLFKIGLLDARRAVNHRTLAEHLEAFLKARRAKGVTEKHVRLLSARIARILSDCGLRFWGDVTAGKVLEKLNDLRQPQTDDQGNEIAGISAQTFNFHLQAFKQFCRWAVKERLIPESPVAHLDGVNVRLDRRHDRRALGEEEFDTLLKTTRKAPHRFGLTGAERALLYTFVSETGLRAREVGTLTPESFRLDDNPPTVTVIANYSKHRREDVLPLLGDTAQKLRDRLKGLPEKTLVFPMPDKPAKMLREDLAEARAAWIRKARGKVARKRREESGFLKYRDGQGLVADFHALRHTFITNLARRGVHPKLAQDLARHCDINLTLSRYSHTVLKERATALQALRGALPEAPTPMPINAGAKTERVPEWADWQEFLRFVFPFCFPQKDGKTATSVDCGGLNGDVNRKAKTRENPRKNADYQGFSSQPPVGFEPTTCGLQNRCSAN